MKLKADSNLIKWAYFWVPDYALPKRTNVCVLFWRCFLWVPLKLVGMTGVLIAFSPIILWYWFIDLAFWKRIGKRLREREARVIVLPSFRWPKLPRSELASLAWRRAKDWKAGVCGIVEIE